MRGGRAREKEREKERERKRERDRERGRLYWGRQREPESFTGKLRQQALKLKYSNHHTLT